MLVFFRFENSDISPIALDEYMSDFIIGVLWQYGIWISMS